MSETDQRGCARATVDATRGAQHDLADVAVLLQFDDGFDEVLIARLAS